MPSPDTRVGMRPSTLQANRKAKPNASAAAAIQSNGRVTPTTWSSCSGFESRSMAASRKIRSVPRFTQAPANAEPTSIWLERFHFFKQILPARAGKALTARFLKPKPSVCSRPGIRAATPNSLISGHENSFPTSSARLAAARRVIRSTMPDWQAWLSRGGQMPPPQKSRRLGRRRWVRGGGRMARQRQNDRRPARGTIGHRKGSAISQTDPAVIPKVRWLE